VVNNCAGTNRLGKPCGFRIAAGAIYCNSHDPGADVSAHRSRAGKASAVARRYPAHYLIEAPIDIHDRAAIQAVLDAVIRLTLFGHLPIDRARIILRACAIASHNFNPTGDTLAGPIPPTYDALEHLVKVQSVLLSADRFMPPSEDDE
jgi:hypothetical protein